MCMRNSVARLNSTAILMAISATTSAKTSRGFSSSTLKAIDIPTEMKNRPEQQALERLEVALELVAVLAVGQQHAAEEGAERRATARCSRSAARRR